MQFPGSPKQPQNLTAGQFALCLLLSSALQIVESLIPKIPLFPWLRFGLTYLIVIPFLLRFGPIKTIVLILSRNLITLIYGGQMMSAFLISSFSGVAAMGAFGWVLVRLYRKGIAGLVGVNVSLAAAFNVAQLVIVNLVFIRHSGFYFQLGPMLIWSAVSGTIIAFFISKNARGLSGLFYGTSSLKPPMKIASATPQKPPGGGGHGRAFPAGVWPITLAAFISLFFLPQLSHQFLALGAILLFTKGRYIKTLIWAWPFLLYIAWLHLFGTPGLYIIPGFITAEGAERFTYFSLRLVNVFFLGRWLSGHMPAIKFRSASNIYINGFKTALPAFPILFGLAVKAGSQAFRDLRAGKAHDLLGVLTAKIQSAIGVNKK